MAIGFVTAFPMTLALMFGMTDIDAVLSSNLPSAEIFYQITQSRGIVTFMMCWVILLYYSKILCFSIPVGSSNIIPSGNCRPMGHCRTHDLGLFS